MIFAFSSNPSIVRRYTEAQQNAEARQRADASAMESLSVRIAPLAVFVQRGCADNISSILSHTLRVPRHLWDDTFMHLLVSGCSADFETACGTNVSVLWMASDNCGFCLVFKFPKTAPSEHLFFSTSRALLETESCPFQYSYSSSQS